MKKYINTSNYYLSTITSKIEDTGTSGTFDISDVTVDGVTLPLQGYYWVDVDFGDVSKREIFRIVSRTGYTLTYDKRISPYGMKIHSVGSTVALRDFSELLNSLSTNTDNFGEVEQTGDLTVLVRGGKVIKSGEAKANTDVKIVPDATFSFSVSSEAYIVLSFDDLAYAFTKVTDTDLLTKEGQYPIAKVTVGTNTISEIIDLRSTMVGGGDMRKAVYDPDGIEDDVFDMNNMKQGDDSHKYVSTTNIDQWNGYAAGKQDKLISGLNIATVNNIDLLNGGNIAIDSVITAGWDIEEITQSNVALVDDEYVYVFNKIPLSSTSFIVMNNSGQILVEGEGGDYVYDEDSHSISFPDGIPSTETYRAWIMYDDAEGEELQYTNFLTQAQYDELPEGQKTNGNVFIIYE